MNPFAANDLCTEYDILEDEEMDNPLRPLNDQVRTDWIIGSKLQNLNINPKTLITASAKQVSTLFDVIFDKKYLVGSLSKGDITLQIFSISDDVYLALPTETVPVISMHAIAEELALISEKLVIFDSTSKLDPTGAGYHTVGTTHSKISSNRPIIVSGFSAAILSSAQRKGKDAKLYQVVEDADFVSNLRSAMNQISFFEASELRFDEKLMSSLSSKTKVLNTMFL